MEEINILTSCDNRLTKHIFTQLKNFSLNLLPKYEVHLWLFHYQISREDIDMLKRYADFLGISFHEVYVFDYEDYEILRKGGRDIYPVEGYLYLLAHKYLPENIDRAVYLDAGDIILDGDIGEFYFAPFDGNFIIATIGTSKQKELYNFDDLKNRDSAEDIVFENFNAGVLLLNLELMRVYNIDMSFYVNVMNRLLENGFSYYTEGYPEPIYYMDDQGLIAAAFVGRTKFWGYEEHGWQQLHKPYNFTPFTFEFNRERLNIPDNADLRFPYEPRIIHFWRCKPWGPDLEKYDSYLNITQKYFDIFLKAESAAQAWLLDYRASR
jgi:lipopolysaccharide biosynthesis glycosyltransferase